MHSNTPKKIDNLVFFSGSIHLRAGGPSGYIANLKTGIDELNTDKIVFLYQKENFKPRKSFLRIIKLLTGLIPFKKVRKTTREYLTNLLLGTFDVSITSPFYKNFIPELDKYDPQFITCHWVKDALFIRNYLKANPSQKSKIILMSHSPEPPSEEFYAAEKASNVLSAEANYKRWQAIEKDAFRTADILLFPSLEAIEPYSKALPYFQELKTSQDFRFLPTGCWPLETSATSEDLRKKFNVQTPYVISYIGRHTKIKGYDLLKEIAQSVLSQRDDVTFLIGGKIGSEITPLKHERWIELGFVNPAEVFKASTCFVLPNRETYFDLILLEALSTGCPVFASATGGNKSVYHATKSIFLYSSQEECVNSIHEFLNTSHDYQKDVAKKTLRAYKDNYTLEIFSKNYINLIEKLKIDYFP